MICRLIPILLAACLASPASAQLNLTATRVETVREGIIFQQLTFKDGEQSVSMELPPRWTARSSAARLQLLPPDLPFSEAVIEVRPLDAPQPPWDEPTLKALSQQALTNVPPGSSGAKIVAEQQNTTVLAGTHPSFEVVVAYQAVGKTFKRSTIFINRPADQLVCRFTAPEPEFDRVLHIFHGAIRSMTWRNAEPAAAPAPAGG